MRPDQAYAVGEDTYPPGKYGRDYFQQALVAKEVFVYFAFPEVDHDWTGE